MASEEPPSYNDATKSKDAPPSYDQLFGMGQMKQQVQEARADSANKGVFAAKLCEIFCGSVACMICVLVLAALPVAMIVIGSIYIDDCRLGNNRIPIWLVVFGCVSLAQTFINICKQCIQQVTKKSNREDGESSSNSVSRGGGCIESFLTGFLFVWIIVGSVWVFGIYDDYLAVGSQCNQCCHPVPYLFSFVVLLVIYTIGALFCCCLCGCFCCLLCLGAASDDS